MASYRLRSSQSALRTLVLFLVPALFVGWAGPTGALNDSAKARQPIDVVATLFPLAQAVGLVGGNDVKVTDLTPVATDPRSFVPGAGERDEIRSASAIVEVGGGFQPAAEAAVAAGAKHAGGNVLKLLESAGGRNPYVWLNPIVMERLAPAIAATLSRADPTHHSDYEQGARDLQAQMSAIDAEYNIQLSDCPKSVIVTAQPSFARLANRYSLTDIAVNPSYRPGTSVSARRIAQVAATVRQRGVTVVFTAPLESAKAADAVAALAGAKTRLLDPIEGLTEAESKRKLSYPTIMYNNLNVLSSALDCPDVGF